MNGKPALIAVVSTVLVLTGCSRVVDGQLAMTVEPISSDLTCGEFMDLSDTERTKAISQVIADDPDKSPITSRPMVLVALATVLCERMPQVKVKQLVMGMRVG